ncbi:hypothetical protein AVEN_161608-1 [Araneus ventricosus]|uniref:Uncharacterized protein n=1 Tax=Araneus ventricosus TaxID=182803 RepID=A0A4Y2FMZ9_ARAVE|nr:hypothetical protein AVEN_161608-1 [Araneus ventricosus]
MIKITKQVPSFLLPRRERDNPSLYPVPSFLVLCVTQYCSFTKRDETTAHASRTAPLQKKETSPGDVESHKQVELNSFKSFDRTKEPKSFVRERPGQDGERQL